MKPSGSTQAPCNGLISTHVREVRLEVSLAGGGRHLVRYPEDCRVRPDSGVVLLVPVRGGPALRVEPGDVVSLRAVSMG